MDKSEITYRKATFEDIDFVIETIIEADKSGGEKSYYEDLFEMTNQELKDFFRKVLLEDISGCELSISDYYLALKDGIPVGGVAGWLEKDGFNSSNYIRAMLYAEHLGEEKWMLVKKKLDSPPIFTLEREAGQYQIELTYIKDSCSGKLTIPVFKNYVINEIKKHYPNVDKIQLYTLFGNVFSFIALIHLGYKIVKKIQFDDVNSDKSFLDKGRILWEKQI